MVVIVRLDNQLKKFPACLPVDQPQLIKVVSVLFYVFSELFLILAGVKSSVLVTTFPINFMCIQRLSFNLLYVHVPFDK